MLNEEKVILMTHMASYENGEGKENVKIGNYFRSDYIAVQVLKSAICGTIAYGIGFGLYALYNLEILLQDLYKMDLIAFAKKVLIYYIISVVAYGVLTYIICTYQYIKAKRNLKKYYHNLKKLSTLYGDGNEENRSSGGRK